MRRPIINFTPVSLIYEDFFSITTLSHGPGHAKTCLMPYANNKGADQPAHPRSLISTFVVRCLDSMYTCYIQRFKILASVCSWARWFVSYDVKNPRRNVFAWCGSHYWWSHLIHLSPLTPTILGAPRMTLKQYLSTFPCLPLHSGNLQTPFLSIL